MNTDGPSLSHLRAADGPATRQSEGGVYDRIRADILSLGLAPASDIDEKTLAAHYGVSRTPIREALIRLSGDGLIVFSPSRGARVSPLIVPNFPRYFEALDLLQRALAQIGALRALPADKITMKAAVSRFRQDLAGLDFLDYQKVVRVADAEAAVLLAIGRCAHNAHLFEAFEKLLVLGQRMMRLPYAYNPDGEDSVEDYAAMRVQIFDEIEGSIAARDCDRAEAGLRRFNQALTRRLTAYLVENLASDVSIEPSGTEDA